MNSMNNFLMDMKNERKLMLMHPKSNSSSIRIANIFCVSVTKIIHFLADFDQVIIIVGNGPQKW